MIDKGKLVVALASLPDSDPRLDRIAEIVAGGGAESDGGEGEALTLTAAADRAGLSRQTLHRAATAGALRVFRPYGGARPRVTEAELERWMGGRCAGVTD